MTHGQMTDEERLELIKVAALLGREGYHAESAALFQVAERVIGPRRPPR